MDWERSALKVNVADTPLCAAVTGSSVSSPPVNHL